MIRRACRCTYKSKEDIQEAETRNFKRDDKEIEAWYTKPK
jgi:hypothetical protein